MIQVQETTAARPGEICNMRPMDIDKSDDELWIYRPPRHKNQHRGQKRTIRLNKKLQALLMPFMLRPDDAKLFSPREAEEWRKARRQEARTSPASCNKTRDEQRRRHPKSQIGDSYDVHAYRRAIHNACDVAGVPRWSPNRLRHNGLTKAARIGGREGARVIGDHKDRRSTDRYVEDHHELADEIAKKMG